MDWQDRQSSARIQVVRQYLSLLFRTPGFFYCAVCGTLFVVEAMNLGLYVGQSDFASPLLPRSAQFLALTAGVLLLFRVIQILYAFAWDYVVEQEPEPKPYSLDRPDLPFVTVQIPLRNEELAIVSKYSIASALALNYPRDRFEIQVIDNSDLSEDYLLIKQWLETEAARNNVSAVFLHRDGTTGFKAGNLNLGLASSRGSFFLILDADSSVDPDALLATLPHFADPKVGYVQLEIQALNEDVNHVTRTAATMARSRARQMRVQATQGFIGFDGHNGMVRREALDAVNGWSEEVSEDLGTAIKMRIAGYKAKYSFRRSGELVPDRLPEMMKQRWRWTTGTAAVLAREAGAIFRTPHLRWFEKLDLFAFLTSLPVESSAYALIFVFVPLPPLTAATILFLWFLPTLVAENFSLRRALVSHLFIMLIVSVIMPTILNATLRSFLPGSHGFAVTRKGISRPLALGTLLRINALGLSGSLLYFAIVLFVMRDPSLLVSHYLGPTILLTCGLITPFALNYSTRMLGYASPGLVQRTPSPARTEN